MKQSAAAFARADVLIIGAGPAGLMCALTAARRGLSVVVADRQTPGRKLAIAGGGMGNVTNRILDPRHYVGEKPDACRAALRAFGARDALALLADLNIPWEEREFGQIFCLRPAAEFAGALEARCRAAGARFAVGSALRAADVLPPAREGEGFCAALGGENLEAARLVLATGSPACPQIGASDFGARLAERWGHRVVPFRPVLTPFLLPEGSPLLGLEGISLPARLVVRSVGGERAGGEYADPAGARPLLLTHRGLSGPAALVASCFWREGDALSIDFLPETPLLDVLHDPANGRLLVKNLLARRLPARLAERLCPPDLAGRKAAELGKADRLRLADAVHRHREMPAGVEGPRKAEAAAGGVALDELTPGLESRRVPGLFFCGELLDMTGLLGGYNIHWALASGCLAGRMPHPNSA